MAVNPIIEALRADWSFGSISEGVADPKFNAKLETDVRDAVARAFRGGGSVWVGREVRVRVPPYTIPARLINLDPPRATYIGNSTNIVAHFVERPKEQGRDLSSFIAEVIRYPEREEFDATFKSLVGLDDIRQDMLQKLTLLLNPDLLTRWAHTHYPHDPPIALITTLRERYPLLILEGEVGTGKTALARSVGYPLSVKLGHPVMLYIVNAQVRGGGHVGELSLNIARAFDEAEQACEREGQPVMLLIDEADALAQARGSGQRHIEDDAGVNTLIQRVDRLRDKPMAVLFATNLVQTLDSALLRRAVGSYYFDRPTEEQRKETFRRLLAPLGASDDQLTLLAQHTAARPIPGFSDKPQRYTYSDLTQRLIPSAVEEAFARDQPLSIESLLRACERVAPTPESAHIHSLQPKA